MKRNEQLLYAVGDVGLDLVELSELHPPFAGQWRRILPVAACLAIAVGLTIGAVRMLPSHGPEAEAPLAAEHRSPASESEITTKDHSTAAPSQSIAQDESAEAPEEEAFEPVIPLYDMSIDYTDGVSNSYFAVYRVPQLNYSSDDALAMNAEISATFGAQVEAQLQSMEHSASLWYSTINYRQYRHGDLLTLVCSMESTTDYDEYAVYHFDTKTGVRLSNKDFLLRMGKDVSTYTDNLRRTVHQYYLKMMLYWNMDPATAAPEISSLLWEQYARTVPQGALTAETPVYADENGQLHAIVPIYSAAGADHYNRILAVTDEPEIWDSAADGELDYRGLLTSLWAGVDPHMTLYLADPAAGGKAYETVTLPMDWYLERLCVLMDGYTWTRQTEPCPAPEGMWINLAGNGINWTFWEDNDAGFLVTQDGEEGAVFWKADYRYETDREAGWTIAQVVRHEYDGAAIDYTGLSVTGTTATEVCGNFCRAMGELLLSQAPGSVYGAKEFEVISWEPTAVGDPKADGSGSSILAFCKIAVIPELDDHASWLWAGNSVEGEGEYEGWLIFSRQMLLAQQSDGTWRCVEMGTGGLDLPE